MSDSPTHSIPEDKVLEVKRQLNQIAEDALRAAPGDKIAVIKTDDELTRLDFLHKFSAELAAKIRSVVIALHETEFSEEEKAKIDVGNLLAPDEAESEPAPVEVPAVPATAPIAAKNTSLKE